MQLKLLEKASNLQDNVRNEDLVTSDLKLKNNYAYLANVESNTSKKRKNKNKPVRITKEVAPVIRTVDRAKVQEVLPCNSKNNNVVGVNGKVIQPYKRLLERYWNPKVQRVLNEIRAARLEVDIDKEKHIYSNVLADERYKTLIGIERIWEECAWTELHQFDDFFRTGVLKDECKSLALGWIEKAKHVYLLPAFAHFFGLNEIRSNITSEELWDLAVNLVESEELQQQQHKEDNNEIRFRLRCLFSSLGHVYSLLAMVDPIHSKKHKETSYKYFRCKRIDYLYSRLKKL